MGLKHRLYRNIIIIKLKTFDPQTSTLLFVKIMKYKFERYPGPLANVRKNYKNWIDSGGKKSEQNYLIIVKI